LFIIFHCVDAPEGKIGVPKQRKLLQIFSHADVAKCPQYFLGSLKRSFWELFFGELMEML
jgi:hypothetical protein